MSPEILLQHHYRGTIMGTKSKTLIQYRKEMELMKQKKRRFRYTVLSLILVLVILITAISIILSSSDNDTDVLVSGTPEPTSAISESAPTDVPSIILQADPTPIPDYNISASSQEFDSFLPVIERNKNANKKIAITIDDCFQVSNLRELIDLANAYGCKLTIFPIGNQLDEPSEAELQGLLNSAVQHGFQIENHTMNHTQVYKLSNEELFSAIFDQEETVRKAIGFPNYKMNFLRLPGGNGEEDPRVHFYMNLLGYKAIADWSYSGSDADIKNIKKNLKSGSVFLFHTTNSDMKKLREFIPYAVQSGYQLVTMNELMGYSSNEASSDLDTAAPQFVPYVYDQYVTMKKGHKMYCVGLMQTKLKSLGYLPADSVIDGDFGSKTEAAVSAFQNTNGLEATGVADIATQAILFSDNAIAAPFK